MIHNWRHTQHTQTHSWALMTNTGAVFLNRHSLVSLETNSTVVNNRAKSRRESQFPARRVSISTAGYGHRKTRWFRELNLRRLCLLCVAPRGSWAARPHWDPRAVSCHPRPSQRRGAWAGWSRPSSCWSVLPKCPRFCPPGGFPDGQSIDPYLSL